MQFILIDDNISLTMNIFLIIANIINIVYNIPQMVKTYKCKSTKDLSSWFLFLRVIANIIWVGYAIEVDSMMMLINTVVTVVASIFIGYYKVLELNQERLVKKNNIHNTHNIHKNKLLNENENAHEHENETKFNYKNYTKINDNDDKLYEV